VRDRDDMYDNLSIGQPVRRHGLSVQITGQNLLIESSARTRLSFW
jgi:hypothetical protein